MIDPKRPLVCLIEDDEDIRELLRQLVADAGYGVLEAADGLAGLSLLQGSSERVVVLLDHKLPLLDGCDLLDTVNHDTLLRARLAVILVTASPQSVEEACGDALRALGGQVLPKPFDVDRVVDAVGDAARRLMQGTAASDGRSDSSPAVDAESVPPRTVGSREGTSARPEVRTGTVPSRNRIRKRPAND